MQISIDKPEQQFIEEQIRSGRFSSPQDVVRGALSLLRAHEDLPAELLSQLRNDIALGIAEADRGDVEPWDVNEIEKEVERRYREGK